MIDDLLSLALLAATALAVAATVALFTIGDKARPRSHGRAVAAAVLAGGATLGVAQAAGFGPTTAVVVAVSLAAWLLLWSPIARDWATRGIAAWALWSAAGASYLAYVAWWILHADLGLWATLASIVLLLLEAFIYLLALGYVWELVDVLARRRWPVTVDLDAADPTYRPFVSLHVPAHNEPPEMVIATLTALLALDYDDFEIVMIDDNTEDEELWRPVEAFCAGHERITFVHLQDWPGYKSGALNYALTVTDSRAEVIGVVDADYIVRPDWLARVAPLFAEPGLSFVQTPQDYRDWETAPYFRRLYHSYAYFFDVSQRSRNEAGGPIFGGTMGLIRKDALTQVGGWDEWCITEDAELSLRLLKAGWTGQHVNTSFGHGLMPLTFEALKRQRFRWCFGGIQILRMHRAALMPWNRDPENRLTQRQRWAYLVGGLQWYGDVAGLAFLAFLFAGAWDLVTGDGLVVRRLSGLLLVALVSLVLLSAIRALACLRRMRQATWGESIGAFGLWLALGWAVAQGALRGSLAREGEFLRTPKQRGELDWRDALRGNVTETVLAVACALGALVTLTDGSAIAVAIAALLALQALGFAAAPINSWTAIRAEPEGRERAALLSWTGGRTSSRLFVWPAAVLGIALVGWLASASPAEAPVITELEERLEDDDPEQEEDQRPRRQRDRGAPGFDAPGARDTSPTTTGSLTEPEETAGSTVAPVPTADAPTTAAPTQAPTTTQAPAPTTAPTQATRPSQAPDLTTPDRTTAPTGAGAGSRP